MPAADAVYFKARQHAERRAAKDACLAVLQKLLHEPEFHDIWMKLQSVHVEKGCIAAKLVLKPEMVFTTHELELLQLLSQRWIHEIQAFDGQMQLPDGSHLQLAGPGEPQASAPSANCSCCLMSQIICRPGVMKFPCRETQVKLFLKVQTAQRLTFMPVWQQDMARSCFSAAEGVK